MGTLKNEMTRTQLAEIRRQLTENGWIDKPTALDICDCDRLGARIWDLRHDPIDPMDIRTVYRTGINRFGHTFRYAVYMLNREEATA